MTPGLPIQESEPVRLARRYRKQCVRLANERDDARAVAARALEVLEVDSDWPVERLLDAIGEAVRVLRA